MADCKEAKLEFTLKELTLSSQSEDVPGSSSTVALRSNKFVCVEYPAVVTNVDKMLETLGGEENLSKVGTKDRDTLYAEFPSLKKLFMNNVARKYLPTVHTLHLICLFL